MFPERHIEDFSNGIGYWIAGNPTIGGPREVVSGYFRSWDWGFDNNHLTTKGGPGMLHLLAYQDMPFWNYFQKGHLVTSDLTNARIKLRVRGLNFVPNGSEFICWITAWHPDFPQWPTPGNKNVNWGFVAEPRTSALLTGDWVDIEWRLDPDPAKWVWGKGEGTYDTYLSVQECLRNVCNVHFLMLGPDNVQHPAGEFHLDSAEFWFNRNGDGVKTPQWDGFTKSGAVDLYGGNVIAYHHPFTSVGGVRMNVPLVGKKFWTGLHQGGAIDKCFGFGVVDEHYNPKVHGGMWAADGAHGWVYMTDRGHKRHNLIDEPYGPVLPSAGSYYMCAFDNDYDANSWALWYGMNGSYFGGGDPALGINPSVVGPKGTMYAYEANGTGNTSWQWRAGFFEEHTPPSGFEGF
jgi:opacity protein-like surface antigen